MRPAHIRARAGLIALLMLAALPTVSTAPARAAAVDATCVASVAITFDPPATEPLPPAPAPHATSTGTGTLTACAVTDGGATTGAFTYQLQGDLTCLSAQNVTGTLDIAWADASHSHATSLLINLGSVGGAAALSATITSGRFTGAAVTVANLRDPLALIACLTTGLAHTTGTTGLTITNPL